MTTTKDHVCDRQETPHRKNKYCLNPRPATVNEHEPAARGEWRVVPEPVAPVVAEIHCDGLIIVGAVSTAMAEQIVTEHNSHTALVEQRDRLRETLREIVAALDLNRREMTRAGFRYTEQQWQAREPVWAKGARAALNEQKDDQIAKVEADQKGG